MVVVVYAEELEVLLQVVEAQTAQAQLEVHDREAWVALVQSRQEAGEQEVQRQALQEAGVGSGAWVQYSALVG